jgi:uncharacterized membrane protein YbhN (UPF0104 family)
MLTAQLHKIQVKPFRVVLLLLALAILYYLTVHFGEFSATMNLLEHSAWIWVGVAVLAMALTVLLGAVIQYVAGNSIGSIADLVLIGLAGSFLNRFLPFSIGGIGLTTEYYRKHDQKRPQAIVMATIPTIIGVITTVLLILLVSPLTFVEFANKIDVSLQAPWVALVVVVCLIIIALIIFIYRKRLQQLLSDAMIGLKGVRNLHQAIEVSGGSILLTLMEVIVLYASILAIHGHLAFVAVFTVFIVSLLVSDIAPTPGGLGATEAVLILGLSGAGLDASQAVAATVIFRFITFLLPILPGAIAIAQLNRLKLGRIETSVKY